MFPSMFHILHNIILLLSLLTRCKAQDESKPNLIVIVTDEQNFRTIGAYRDQLQKYYGEILGKKQGEIWGEDVKVETTHIDSLAKEGALFTNFNVATPVCTASRASFQTGAYPSFTGANSNHKPMKEVMVTFAEELKREGYFTSYLGKWHLNGQSLPGWAYDTKGMKWGYMDRQFMFNRGHWKLIKVNEETKEIDLCCENEAWKLHQKISEAKDYATDFLFDNAMSKIDNFLKNGTRSSFAMMISIPDPHGPDVVRKPYDEMYDKFEFKSPETMTAALLSNPAVPKWADDEFNKVYSLNQKNMKAYFGAVKLIDDKVGELLAFLDRRNLKNKTIIVFTSDHGDMLGEHSKVNKGLPYKASVSVPFIIRYPGQIKPAKTIHTPYSTVDFAPTILSMMGIHNKNMIFNGTDASIELLSNSSESTLINKKTYFTDDTGQWASVCTFRYKLVVSLDDKPWLFDQLKDPNELVNYYMEEEYKNISNELITFLIDEMVKFKDPMLIRVRRINLTGACVDHPGKNNFLFNGTNTCEWLAQQKKYFKRNKCSKTYVKKFCFKTCSGCTMDIFTQLPSNSPSVTVSSVPSLQSSVIPSTSPSTIPTSKSSLVPTRQPSNIPSISLSLLPSVQSSVIPSTSPTTMPTAKSSLVPTRQLFDSPTKLFDGIACENSFQCKSNFCLEICMRKKVKASCVKNKECLSDRCRSKNKDKTKKRCTLPLKEAGVICKVNKECKSKVCHKEKCVIDKNLPEGRRIL